MTFAERQAIAQMPALLRKVEELEKRVAELEKQRPTLSLKGGKANG